MLDEVIFSRHMNAFGERIGKKLGDDSLAMFYAALASDLTTEEFQRGMAVVFRAHKFNTWPAPQEIIDAARPPSAPEVVALEAAAAWTVVCDAARLREPTRPFLLDLERVAGPVATRTFEIIGGTDRFKRCDDYRLDRMREEFVERYGAVKASEGPALLNGKAPRLLRLVAGGEAA